MRGMITVVFARFLLCAGRGGKARTVKPSLPGGIDLATDVDLAEVVPYYDEAMIQSPVPNEAEAASESVRTS